MMKTPYKNISEVAQTLITDCRGRLRGWRLVQARGQLLAWRLHGLHVRGKRRKRWQTHAVKWWILLIIC